jgi:hypothetical protein
VAGRRASASLALLVLLVADGQLLLATLQHLNLRVCHLWFGRRAINQFLPTGTALTVTGDEWYPGSISAMLDEDPIPDVPPTTIPDVTCNEDMYAISSLPNVPHRVVLTLNQTGILTLTQFTYVVGFFGAVVEIV